VSNGIAGLAAAVLIQIVARQLPRDNLGRASASILPRSWHWGTELRLPPSQLKRE